MDFHNDNNDNNNDNDNDNNDNNDNTSMTDNMNNKYQAWSITPIGNTYDDQYRSGRGRQKGDRT